MGWGATLFPLSDFADEWEWLAGCVVDPLPAAPPPPRPAAGAAAVLRLLLAAGLSGDTSPLVDDALDHLGRNDADVAASSETTLTHVLLVVPSAPGTRQPDRVDPATPVQALGLSKPHPHAVLRAAEALVPVWGPTVAMEHSGCLAIVVDGPIPDVRAASDRWLAT